MDQWCYDPRRALRHNRSCCTTGAVLTGRQYIIATFSELLLHQLLRYCSTRPVWNPSVTGCHGSFVASPWPCFSAADSVLLLPPSFGSWDLADDLWLYMLWDRHLLPRYILVDIFISPIGRRMGLPSVRQIVLPHGEVSRRPAQGASKSLSTTL